MAPSLSVETRNGVSDLNLGIGMVAAAALIWSFGGTIARFIDIADPWTVVLWRAGFASVFLLVFMLWRSGVGGTAALFRGMGMPGIGVACCFGIASSSFVVALQHTSVANILLIQAAAPLIAASLAFAVFRERVSAATWMAIAAVAGGIAIMVSSSISGKISPLGDGLALLIAVCFSIGIVIIRHWPHVGMAPAGCLGTGLAALAAAVLAGSYAVSLPNLGWLFLFGAGSLGLGLAVFVTGARLVPAALAALISTVEPVLGPLWVWIIHAEVPGTRTLIGGAIVFAALLIHIFADWQRTHGARRNQTET
jgi:drug/metabolite transporter (DMT)-like permease